MVKVKDVFELLNKFAPVERKMDFDNVGLLVGDRESEVKKILVALDVTDDVVSEAILKKCDLIVSHHPLIFTAMKAVVQSDLTGRKVIELVKNGISVISMHTNLDVSHGGVNDTLAKQLGLKNIYCPYPEGKDGNENVYGLMRCGEYDSEITLDAFLKNVKETLGASGLRFTDAGRNVRKVAVVGGAGNSEIMDAYLAGCDTYVTADVKHNGFIDAKELGMNLVDGGHFCTENGIVDVLSDMISAEFNEITVEISDKCCQTEQFYV